jgi:threonyl-tRNA synthetase
MSDESMSLEFHDITGKKIPFHKGMTGQDVVEYLGLKDVKALVQEGVLLDLRHVLQKPLDDRDQALEWIVPGAKESLEIVRHDCAHVLGQAVQELYPGTQITIGPTIEDGFYYDFLPAKTFTDQDLIAIEARMHEIVDRDDAITREVWSRDEAIAYFRSRGELFKVSLIESIPEGEALTVYQQGNFVDLCRGPHGLSTKGIGHGFKLMRLAGAYWRGDSSQPMLQRIYGTAWENKEDLEKHLAFLQAAQGRDHRRLGQEMDLFHVQEEAPGDVFWHPKGWFLYRRLQEYIRLKLGRDYQEVRTPHLLDRALWERSGHWEKFRDAMLVSEVDDRTFALKPMNCPCHVELFRRDLKSYRDLPLRIAEFGSCVRYEPSGALKGLMRLRAFTQDDAHIFCTPDQINGETKQFCDLLRSVYKDFGFHDLEVKFADRPKERAGDDDSWDRAEQALMAGAQAAGLSYKLHPGEGAFYGPKLEFVLKDALGRPWQCGTLQVDFVLPKRLGALYTDKDGKRYEPVMLHRAILGSFERFIGILIEHYGGKFPLWLAPVQVAVATLSEEQLSYGHHVVQELRKVGLRVQEDFRNEKIGYKIRSLVGEKIPFIIILGKNEVQEKTVSLRYKNHTQTLELCAVLAKLQEEVCQHSPEGINL